MSDDACTIQMLPSECWALEELLAPLPTETTERFQVGSIDLTTVVIQVVVSRERLYHSAKGNPSELLS